MFPRIAISQKKNNTYKYLVISESIRKNGKSTTKNIANLGNLTRFAQQDIENLIDGLIKIFTLDKYVLCDDVEIIEALEHGTIMFWRKLWQELGLSTILRHHLKMKMEKHTKPVQIAVDKYVEMMVINRCVRPSSKRRTSNWVDTTSYKVMKGYSESELCRDVNYFYRSMDHLIEIKDAVELAIFERLRNLFSVNVTLTFYDMTSTFFSTKNCPLGAHGYSRDHRSDCEQIVIGVVTTYEGYPIKHYVFKGNTTDVTTVTDVIKGLKQNYHLEETVFVGDRGMISKLNLAEIEEHGFDYIIGVKMHQNELYQSLLARNEYEFALDWEQDEVSEYRQLKVIERVVGVKEFLSWKAKLIVREHHMTCSDDTFRPFVEQIQGLTNTSKPDFRTFRKVLRECVPQVDSKLCQKIIALLKRYENHYDDEPRFIICLNPERQKSDREKRETAIEAYKMELDTLFSAGDSGEKEKEKEKEKRKRTSKGKKQKSEQDLVAEREEAIAKLFGGYKAKYRKFFQIERETKTRQATGYRLNQHVIDFEYKLDGVFALLTSRTDLEACKVIDSYKNLQEVETLFDDVKHFVDIHPLRHRLEERVRAHVFVCILALLLKRLFEIRYLKGTSVSKPLAEIEKVKLVRYKVKFSQREDRHQVIPKVTMITPNQKKYFHMIGLKNPSNLELFMW